MKKIAVSLKLVVVGMALASVSMQSAASGFQLFEGNAVNIGDFGAGGAAIAEDASTAFYNPAGLVRITTPQLVLSGVGLKTKSDFSGTSRTAIPLPYPTSGSVNGGGFKLVPAFHYALPLNERVVFGFSMTAPFGLATDYDTHSVIRYEATKSEVKTLDLSPSLGVKINEQLSVGAGLNLQKLDAALNSTIPLTVRDPKNPKKIVGLQDGQIINKAESWALGWHAGALYQLTPSTRFGINYASQVKHHLTGTSRINILNHDIVSSDALSSDITLPPVTTVSAYHALNEQWALLGSVVYTQWKKIENITLNNLPAGINKVILPENFRNTWRVAVGTNYKFNEQWLFRAGVGYDQTPVNDHDRGVRLPDGDRIGAAIGAHYQPSKALGIDMGYTHLFIKDGAINHNLNNVHTVGTVKSAADLVGLQLTWSMI